MFVLDDGALRAETAEEFRARMEAKAAQQRRFLEADARAAASQEYARRHPTKTPPASRRPAAPPVVAAVFPAQAPKQPRQPAPRRRGHTHCVDCGRPFHPKKGKVEGGVRLARNGRCWRCDTLSHGGTPRERMPEACRLCGWKMRSSGHSAREHPGTRIYAGFGLCATCTRREQRRAHKRSMR